jgi:hypothetical protein
MRSSTIIWIVVAGVALSACTKKNSLYMEAGGGTDARQSSSLPASEAPRLQAVPVPAVAPANPSPPAAQRP